MVKRKFGDTKTTETKIFVKFNNQELNVNSGTELDKLMEDNRGNIIEIVGTEQECRFFMRVILDKRTDFTNDYKKYFLLFQREFIAKLTSMCGVTISNNNVVQYQEDHSELHVIYNLLLKNYYIDNRRSTINIIDAVFNKINPTFGSIYEKIDMDQYKKPYYNKLTENKNVIGACTGDVYTQLKNMDSIILNRREIQFLDTFVFKEHTKTHIANLLGEEYKYARFEDGIYWFTHKKVYCEMCCNVCNETNVGIIKNYKGHIKMFCNKDKKTKLDLEYVHTQKVKQIIENNKPNRGASGLLDGIKVEEYDEEFMRSYDLSYRTVFVEAAMGIGKTQTLIKVLKDVIDSNQKYIAINIMHRITQTYCNMKTFKDLDPESYMNGVTLEKPMTIVQLESIMKALQLIFELKQKEKSKRMKTKIILICDEMESIMDELHSSLGSNHHEVKRGFEALLKESDIVILMDAFFSERSYEHVKNCRSNSNSIVYSNKRTIKTYGYLYEKEEDYLKKFNSIATALVKNLKAEENDTDDNLTYVYNAKGEKKALDKIALVSDSKTELATMITKIKELGKIEDIELKILFINGEDDKAKRTLENLNESWPNYDVVAFTPALIASASFDLENIFDLIFAYYTGNTISATACLQQTRRIRRLYTSSIHIYIQEKSYRYLMDVSDIEKALSTNENLIKKQFHGLPDRTYSQLDFDGNIIYPFKDNNYWRFVYAVKYISENRSFFNELFMYYAKKAGIQIINVENQVIDEEQKSDLIFDKKLKKEQVKDEIINNLLNAEIIDQTEREELSKKKEENKPLTTEEYLKIEKFDLAKVFDINYNNLSNQKNFIEKYNKHDKKTIFKNWNYLSNHNMFRYFKL